MLKADLPPLPMLFGKRMSLDNKTLSLNHGKKTPGRGQEERAFVPVMRILYCGDLSRIGEKTSRETFESGQWVGLGRLEPLFEPRGGGRVRPLADPYISRGQAVVRWNAARSCFEIKPSDSARLSVARVDLRRSESAPRREVLTGQTFLPPGALIDIGGRILLLFEHRLWHGPDEDRLEMVGESNEMWALRQILCDVAGFERSVLILGETGVGKELVARALHAQSLRSKGPFVATNCAALPEQLIESLLFGHKKGAFTGATSDSAGLFVQAQGGTLFLDELGEMPMGPQAKLLRVLEEKVVVPVGSKRSIPVDVRVMAATNRLPDNAIEQGKLRSDLYYRLASHIIKVPTLYQRFLDVPELFVQFLSQNLAHKPSLSWLWANPPGLELPVPMDFFLRLLRHRWRGNVRELGNQADQTALLNLRAGTFKAPEGIGELEPAVSESAVYEPASPPARSHGVEAQERVQRIARKLGLQRKTAARLLELSELPELGESPHDEASLDLLREHLAGNLYALMEREDFNQTHMAATLGISRSTLIGLLKRFGLPRAQDLSEEVIARAQQAAGGDHRAMARLLRVSVASLKLRLSQSPS